MSTIIIRSLGIEDSGPLFKFELDNKVWFESHVAPRPPDFYSVQGVNGHIEQLLSRYEVGTFHPSIILNQAGEVLGRANLKDIDQHLGVAEIGYRITQQSIGQGLATKAVRYLIEIACQRWQLKMLNAVVAENNKASMRVLEKCGFVRSQHVPQIASVGDQVLDGYTFQLRLDDLR
ncbi:GNAT family N-acetyltransferase [Undibacterium sp. Di24W]|uniref:GNAT family N-acetyltransferase n=1 Tax=Undibacterium sp. Di24W TaxID=3413033 RepID=UPI003BF2E481